MDELQQYVPQVHFEQIPIKNLVSNQEYQRNLSLGHVKKAAENFDLFQINPVKVSRRNGINYVFNGQHTIEIVALVSGSRDTPVWCMIYDELDYEQEADIFANQQKFVKTLLPYEIFMANVEAGNDKQLIIKSLVESYNLTITSTKAVGGICAISTLETIHDKYGFHMLDRSLRLCIGTWDGDPNSMSGSILMGIAKFLEAYGDEVKDDIFKDRIGKLSVREVIRTAKERRNGTMGYAETFLIAYNKRTKGALKWNKLYKNRRMPEELLSGEDMPDEYEDYTGESEEDSDETISMDI